MTDPVVPGRQYYDSEATAYDDSRGGAARARAAATAITTLVPGSGTALDAAGGTGIVTAELAARGWSVWVADTSLGMLGVARGRLPGRLLASSAARLAVRSASMDLVTTIWLLHLLSPAEADRVITEAARVLRSGGHLVTTVDKPGAHGRAPVEADERARVTAAAGDVGLVPVGESSFSGSSRWGSATGGDPVFTVLALRKVSG